MRLKCPFCGCEKFIKITEEIVTIDDDGEILIDEIVDCVSIEYICCNCKANVTELELAR